MCWAIEAKGVGAVEKWCEAVRNEIEPRERFLYELVRVRVCVCIRVGVYAGV